MFDASALTKRYASEPGHDRVLALIKTAGELLVAAHCQTELASALLRRRRMRSFLARHLVDDPFQLGLRRLGNQVVQTPPYASRLSKFLT